MSLHCREPRLEEMLADAIIQAVMEADGVDPGELEAELRQTAALLQTRPGALQFHRHPHSPIFAQREASYEVGNCCLERHRVDSCLRCTLPLCSQRFDHVEIASIIRSPCCAHNRRVGRHRRRARA
jgi:hypothetical protein